MSQPELLSRVIRVLERGRIPYMMTGSIVSSYYGEPRASHDIDVLVAIREADLPELAAAFSGPSYYLDLQSAAEAIRRRDMFTLLHIDAGDKVGFWLLTDEAFDTSRFARRREEQALGTRMVVPSPEDVILAKLRWCKLAGGSEKQFGDVLRVYELQYARLDTAYLRRWVTELGLKDLWSRLQREAEPLAEE